MVIIASTNERKFYNYIVSWLLLRDTGFPQMIIISGYIILKYLCALNTGSPDLGV